MPSTPIDSATAGSFWVGDGQSIAERAGARATSAHSALAGDAGLLVLSAPKLNLGAIAGAAYDRRFTDGGGEFTGKCLGSSIGRAADS